MHLADDFRRSALYYNMTYLFLDRSFDSQVKPYPYGKVNMNILLLIPYNESWLNIWLFIPLTTHSLQLQA